MCSALHLEKTLKLLDDHLNEADKRWFHEHPQFKHLWHLKSLSNMLTGLKLLLVRTVETKKKKEAWFVVNGVPIRYSIREHALLTGFYCHPYPENHKNLGSMEMVNRVFQRGKNVRQKDIEEKFKLMTRFNDDEEDVDRLHVAVLLLLTTITENRKRDDLLVDEAILRLAGDLEACKSYPWGRHTFEQNLDTISKATDKTKRPSGSYWKFPGFSIPLQLLAFAAIPSLGERFTEPNPAAPRDCPRMCRQAFKSHVMRSAFTLSVLHEALGKTTVISTILDASRLDQSLIFRMMGNHVEEDVDDPVVDSWIHWVKDRGELIWPALLHLDVEGREGRLHNPETEAPNDDHTDNPPDDSSQPTSARDSFLRLMEDGFKKINERVDLMARRLEAVENYVKFGPVDNEAHTGGNDGPTAGNEGPTAGNEGPTAGNEGPTAGNEGFANGYEGFAYGNEGFAAGNEGFSGANEGFAGGNDGHTGDKDQPTADKEQSTADKEASIETNHTDPSSPTAAAAASATSATNPGCRKHKLRSFKKNSLPKKRRLKASRFRESPYYN